MREKIPRSKQIINNAWLEEKTERERERENSKKQVPSCFWIKMLKQLDNVRGGDWGTHV